MNATVAGTLCEKCRRLLEDVEANRSDRDHLAEYRPFHEDMESLQRSLKVGCAICAALPYKRALFLRDEIRYGYDDAVPHTQSRQYTWLDFKYWHDRLPESQSCWFHLFRVDDDNATLFDCAQQASHETNTGSDIILNVASEWMSRCVHHHDQCRSNMYPGQYPSKLLDIQQEGIVRLLETEKYPFEGPYATLSHCWRDVPFKVLTSQTLPEFRTGLKVQDIPPTFRDAIHVARHLKIPYLWIDCYCILQSEDHTSEDRQHEIARMGEIYSNAIINIGAAAAASPTDGYFVQRESTSPIKIQLTSRDQKSNQQYLLFDDEWLSEDYVGFAAPSRSSIFRRAWCMQERFLCQRMLHFCKSGLFWECNAVRIASDLSPVRYYSTGEDSYNIRPFSLWADDDSQYTGLPSVVPQEWMYIVDGYSEMELSRPAEDKFAACGGVAKVMAEQLKDEYVAGFMRRNLVHGLAWMRRGSDHIPSADHVAEMKPEQVRSKRWRAPSWSWASMDVAVDTAKTFLDVPALAQIVGLHYELVDPSNVYGAMSSAKITLKGWALDVKSGGQFNGLPAFVHRGEDEIMVTFDDATGSSDHLMLFLTMGSSATSVDLADQSHFYGLALAPVDKGLVTPAVSKRVGAFQFAQIPTKMRQAFTKKTIDII